MPTRSSRAEWHGALRDGHGHMSFGNGAYDGEFSFGSRFMELEAEASGVGTNPEELIAAAHAGCFSMQLSGLLSKDGHPPRRISTTVRVKLEVGQQGADITSIELETEGEVAGHRRRNVFQNGRNREGHMSGIEGAQGSEDQREGDPAVSLRRQPAGASCCDCRHPSENKSVPTELGPQSSIDMISLFAGMGRHVGKRSAELGGFDQNPGE